MDQQSLSTHQNLLMSQQDLPLDIWDQILPLLEPASFIWFLSWSPVAGKYKRSGRLSKLIIRKFVAHHEGIFLDGNVGYFV